MERFGQKISLDEGVLIPSFSGLVLEGRRRRDHKSHPVLIPSFSGLVLERDLGRVGRPGCLNPFFFRVGVGRTTRSSVRTNRSLNPFFFRVGVGTASRWPSASKRVLIPSFSGLVLEGRRRRDHKSHPVLIPSFSGLVLERDLGRVGRPGCLNPFFFRVGVGRTTRSSVRTNRSLNPFFFRVGVGTASRWPSASKRVLIPSFSGLVLESRYGEFGGEKWS